MTLTSNPTNTRLKYIWDKQKPQPHPVAMIDLLTALGERLGIDWIDPVEDAARRADPRLHEALKLWRSGSDAQVDVPLMNAVMAAIVEIPAFKKPHPIDGLMQWFAKEMDIAYRAATAPPSKTGHSEGYRRYRQLVETLEDPTLIEWFEKRKPNLTKMGPDELFEAVEKFEEDRVPEVVYKFKDGSTIVKLATRTQIQAEGGRLDNCLREGSSFTDNYCRLAAEGKSEFFSLRDKYGDSVLSIQWSSGEKGPEQVYGQDNREPDADEAEKVEEWVSSKGGSYKPKPFSRLRGAVLEIAQFLAEECPEEDDEYIESYAMEWNDGFSVDEAKTWVAVVGCYGYGRAKVIEDAGLDPEEWSKLSDSIHEYIDHGYTKDADEILPIGLLASTLKSSDRGPRPSLSAPEGQERLPFGESVFEQRALPPPPPVQFEDFRPDEDEAMWLAEAQSWIDAGWDDKDDWDDLIVWWQNWFSPEDAWIFTHDMAEYARQNGNRSGLGIPVETAVELRDMGISATNVEDALYLTPATVNIHDIDAIVQAVEATRLKNNRRRRRTSRRRPPLRR